MLLLMASLAPSLVGAQQSENPPSQPDTASAAVTDAVRLAWNRTLEFSR